MLLTNSVFTDDILMFSREDLGSVDLMMQAFNKFANSTGVCINPNKSRIYFGAVDKDTKESICTLTTYIEGKFKMKDVYNLLIKDTATVWHNIMFNNPARPRATMIMRMACHRKLATKERLYRIFGLKCLNGSKLAIVESTGKKNLSGF
ncbi:unnamed protein product [Vicia faba]|uniref:Reverse transcriptase domain-containing protein n=1 Tax=Vicia faba TaxID=3906 RepID=A0AAV0ZZR6_VICFA|nr:unnamed protein product [Vicia faba]